MNKGFLLFCLFFLLMIFNVDAQKINKKAKNSFNKGVSYFNTGDFDNALANFIIADSLDAKDPLIIYYIGASYCELHNFQKSLNYLVLAKNKSLNERELYFYLGRSLHLNHQFSEAILEYQKYYTLLKGAEKSRKAEIERLIKNCENGIELMFYPMEVEIKNAGPSVNSKFPDYNPVISADEKSLIFTSRRDNSTGGLLDPEDGLFHEDIYISHKQENAWSDPVSISSKINTESHDACIGLSADGQQMLIYKATSNGGDIFISSLKGDQWTAPKNLGSNINTPGWESSGSISADNNVLFFTSDKKGGVGGTDIYMSRRQTNGDFGPAKLLGPQINTPEDELSPFIHADGKTLYFSSRGHNSMGGFDIFSVQINLETGEILSDPENIGYPINTADDDVYFVWSADNSRAYFSSFREEGFGEKDIYMLERNIAFAPLVVWMGTVHDAITREPIEAQIVVTDNVTKQVIGVYTPNSSTGRYTVILPAGRNYGIAVDAEGYTFYSKNINIPDLDTYQEIKDSITLNPLIKGSSIVLRNVFFDVNKSDLRGESEVELDRLYTMLSKNLTIKRVEIGGHTDSDGNKALNIKLSENRAKSVYDYLVSKGISKERLIFKGYGDTKPMVPNDTPENKQLNRRTEIVIIE
ncbi:MAG: OmpA family protein [Cytophagaceae bacterium]